MIVSRSGPYLLHLNPFSENTPDLDGRILYATDHGPANLELIATHPDRTPYLESTDLTTAETLIPTDIRAASIKVTPITVERAPVLTVRARVTNTTGDPVVVASLRVGTTVESPCPQHDVDARADLRHRVARRRVAPDSCPEPSRSTDARGSIRVDAATGDDPDTALGRRARSAPALVPRRRRGPRGARARHARPAPNGPRRRRAPPDARPRLALGAGRRWRLRR